MPEAIETTNGNAGPIAPPIVMCDEPGCTQPATFTYLWDWGKGGNCCSLHQSSYNQMQESLQRRCSFGALQPAAPPPLVRSERIQLRAEIGTLEAELVDAKARGIELYNQNTELTRQVQSLRIRNIEADAQLKDQKALLQAMEARLMDRESALVESRDEGLRLKALLPREAPTPAPQRSGRGVRTSATESVNVIEGSGEPADPSERGLSGGGGGKSK